MKRVWLHYRMLEETYSSMWVKKTGEKRQNDIKKAYGFMCDVKAFEDAMRRIPIEWPNSCKVNFTAPGVNKLAWLGHAACSIQHGLGEDCVRTAWNKLDVTTQDQGNAAAQCVLDEWMQNNA